MKIGSTFWRSTAVRWSVVLFALIFPAMGIAQDGWKVARPTSSTEKDLNAVYFVDSKRGWVGGDDGLVLFTSDSGKTWEKQTVGVSTGVNDIYFRDKDNGFLLTGNRIYQTRNGGRDWRESQVFDTTKFGGTPELYSMRFTSKNKGWLVGSISHDDAVIDSLVLRSEDGGTSWRRVIVPTRQELFHLDFVSDKRGWIVGVGGTILFTNDEGDSWTSQRPGVRTDLYHVDFRNDDRGWIVGEDGMILRTVDGGGTWLQSLTQLKNRLLSVQFVDDKRGWAVGRGGVILRSDDGGISWIRQASRATQNLFALFVESKNAWAVGRGGLVLQFER